MASGSQPDPRGIRPLYAVFVPSIGNVVFVSTLIVLVFRIGNGLLHDGDTGYHIRAGEEILKTWRVPAQDLFSFHFPPLKWTAHEWLSEVLLAAIHNISGLTGVVISFAALLSATYWLLYLNLSRYSKNVILVILTTILAIATSSTHWLVRPHVFSLLLTTFWYCMLDRFQYENRATLTFLPLLMLLWVNLHGGFFFGVVLLCLYLVGNLLSGFFAPSQDAINYRAKARKLLACLILTIVACGVNPIGFKILLFPLRVTSDSFIMDGVVEFMSPNFHETLPFMYMLLSTIGALALSRATLNPIQCALLLLVCYMALYSARYISLFAIIAAPLLLESCNRALDTLPEPVRKFIQRRNTNLSLIDRKVQGYVWPTAIVSLVIGLAVSGVLRFAFDEKRFPVAAVEFINRESITGKMFNNDEFGDYIIFKAWPRYRVFIDGRSDMYGRKWGEMYLKVASVQPGWDELLEQSNITWTIFDTYSPLTAALRSKTDWQAIYSDDVATIFLKKTADHRSLLAKYARVSVPGREVN
jgi:hypothetical protein